MFGNVLQMTVGLRRLSLGCLARHGCRMWRDDDGRFGVALGNPGINAVLVVSAVGGERGYHARDLVEQGAGLLGRGRRGGDLAAAGVQADV